MANSVRSATTVMGGVPALMACLPKVGASPRTTADNRAADTPCVWALLQLLGFKPSSMATLLLPLHGSP
jgi:hypothetical protein